MKKSLTIVVLLACCVLAMHSYVTRTRIDGITMATDPLQPGITRQVYTIDTEYRTADRKWKVLVEKKGDTNIRHLTITKSGEKKALYVLNGDANEDGTFTFANKKKGIRANISLQPILTIREGETETKYILFVTNQPRDVQKSVKIQR